MQFTLPNSMTANDCVPSVAIQSESCFLHGDCTHVGERNTCSTSFPQETSTPLHMFCMQRIKHFSSTCMHATCNMLLVFIIPVHTNNYWSICHESKLSYIVILVTCPHVQLSVVTLMKCFGLNCSCSAKLADKLCSDVTLSLAEQF